MREGQAEVVGYGLTVGCRVMLVVPSLLMFVFPSLAVSRSRMDIVMLEREIDTPSSF